MPGRLPVGGIVVSGIAIAVLAYAVAALGVGLAAFVLVPGLAAPVVIEALRRGR